MLRTRCKACKCTGKFRVRVVDFEWSEYLVAMVLTYRYRIKDATASVLDAGWSTLRSQLRYKATRHGAEYIEVDERFSTQVCSACGARGGPQGREGLVVREWICNGCGARHDRDINSAINLLVSGRNVGLRQTEIPPLQGGEDVKTCSSVSGGRQCRAGELPRSSAAGTRRRTQLTARAAKDRRRVRYRRAARWGRS